MTFLILKAICRSETERPCKEEAWSHMSTRTASDKIENPLQKMENIYIPHPTFTVALERVQRALMMHGAGTSVLGVRITGPAGAGKTTLRRKLREDYPIVCDGYTTGDAYIPKMTSDHRPFVDIDMPDQPTVIRLARELISQYTSNKEAKRGGRSILEERVFDYVVGCGTKCIFIDDAQRAVDRNGEVVTDDLSDWLKSLRVKTGVIVVLSGLGRLDYMFVYDSQIRRRWKAAARIEPYRWLNADGSPRIDDQEVIMQILKASAKRSPIPYSADVDVRELSDKAAEDFALRFMYATQGLVGIWMQLKYQCAELHMLNPRKYSRINLALLEAAYEEFFGNSRPGYVNHVNPFGCHWRQQQPPPIEDDSALIHPKRRTKKQKRAALKAALQKS